MGTRTRFSIGDRKYVLFDFAFTAILRGMKKHTVIVMINTISASRLAVHISKNGPNSNPIQKRKGLVPVTFASKMNTRQRIRYFGGDSKMYSFRSTQYFLLNMWLSSLLNPNILKR
jgi:hypothetical protein